MIQLRYIHNRVARASDTLPKAQIILIHALIKYHQNRKNIISDHFSEMLRCVCGCLVDAFGRSSCDGTSSVRRIHYNTVV